MRRIHGISQVPGLILSFLFCLLFELLHLFDFLTLRILVNFLRNLAFDWCIVFEQFLFIWVVKSIFLVVAESFHVVLILDLIHLSVTFSCQ